jgi:hypothetical protein
MSTVNTGPFDWAANGAFSAEGPRGPRVPPSRPADDRSAREAERDRLYDVTGRTAYENGQGAGGGRGGGGGRASAGSGGGTDRHQGDRLIHTVERIEIRSDRDILALAKAINHLGRELHLILGMRAEEINGVLSTYKGKWFTFGASSRVKARLVSAHLKVSAEAAKALGVGALKMGYAFDRHFVKPEQEAKRQRGKKTARREFTIGGE